MLRAVAGGGGGGVTIGGAVTGGTAYRVLFIDASGNLSDSADFTFGGAAAGTGLYLAAGTATTDVNAQSWTQTWNAAGVTFTADKGIVTATAYTANSLLFDRSTSTGSHRFQGKITVNTADFYVDGPSSGTARLLLRGNNGSSNHQIVSQSAAALKLDSYTGGLDFHISGVPKLTIGTDGQALFGGNGADNGQRTGIKSLTELTTIAALTTTDTAIQIPANAIVVAVSVRVTTVIPTATTFTVTGTTTGTTFNTAAVSTAATTTDKGTAAGAYVNTTAQTVRITPNLTPLDNSGRVRVTIHYLEITPPTS